jgi:hypothetical protein
MHESIPYLNLSEIAVKTRQRLVDQLLAPIGGLAMVELEADPKSY